MTSTELFQGRPNRVIEKWWEVSHGPVGKISSSTSVGGGRSFEVTEGGATVICEGRATEFCVCSGDRSRETEMEWS